ncbi:MAG: hypothetical protein AAF547_19615 [Actinomycetota bacterium]
MSQQSFDRSTEDVGNILLLEHVNVTSPDPMLTSLFYVDGLGLTRDPYIDLGPDLQWINAGRQQFHLPVGPPQVVRGTIEVIVPDLVALVRRLGRIADRLSGTAFEYRVDGDGLAVRGPWGNRFRCVGPAPGDRVDLGLRCVELDVPTGTAEGIGRFYREVIGSPVAVADGRCTVIVGPGQMLRFRETTDGIADYDGHHIAVYVADFSGPHRWLVERDLILEESDRHQYRFLWIADPESGERLFELEHEVRSLHHPLYQRPLVNRNAEQRLPTYTPGADPHRPGEGGAAAAVGLRDALTTVG